MSRLRDVRRVAEELWHVSMPGYYHEPYDSPDNRAYREEARKWLDRQLPPFGDTRIANDLETFLSGGGVVRCGRPAHERGQTL